MNLTGVVSITKPNYQEAIVDGKIIKGYQNLNHCFHGDTVEVNEDKVIKVVETDIKNAMIPGILHINSKYKFGFNRKKMPIYRFVPLDWKYPEFMVASSMKGENRYVVIKFMNWESKFPNGRIVKFYDNFDYELLLYKWNLYQPNIKFDLDEDFSPLDHFSASDLINYRDYRENEVFSIDPLGSKDIDDAFSIDKTCNRHRLGIHIADVSFYLRQFNLDKLLKNRYSSIYLPNKVINMLPDILANNICSLRENRDRLAFTIWIIFNDQYEIEDYSFSKTIIRNRKQYSYEEADEIFVNQDIGNISKHIGKTMFKMDTDNWDSHKMVEVYMLLCNHLVALMLKDKKSMIYRIHSQAQGDNVQTVPKELENIVKILHSNSAEYVSNIDGQDFIHHGLNIKYYTHFTSPIRRIVDIYVHQVLNSEVTNLLDIDCDKINQYNKSIKKLERDINRHKFIQSIIQQGSLNYEAYIIKIEEHHLTIYIPSEKIIYRFRTFNKLLDHMIKIELKDDKVVYLNQESLRDVELNLYEKIDITIHSKYDNRNIGIVVDKLNDLY